MAAAVFAVPCAFDGNVKTDFGSGYAPVDPSSITVFVNDTIPVIIDHVTQYESIGYYVLHIDAGGQNIRFKISGDFAEQPAQYCNSSKSTKMDITSKHITSSSSSGSGSSGSSGSIKIGAGSGTGSSGSTGTSVIVIGGNENETNAANQTNASIGGNLPSGGIDLGGSLLTGITTEKEKETETEQPSLITGLIAGAATNALVALIVIIIVAILYYFWKSTSKKEKSNGTGPKNGANGKSNGKPNGKTKNRTSKRKTGGAGK